MDEEPMFPRLLSVWVTAVLAAGCYECSAENCPDGCCSAKGVCIVQPTSDLECGMGGLLCQNCTERLGSACLDHQCKPRCNVSTCTGCCTESGTCISAGAENEMACGDRGAICQSCGANRVCERLSPTTTGKCCGRTGRSCVMSYECCIGYSCRVTGTGGFTCQQ